MLDDGIRIGLLVLVGLTLAIVLVWYVRFLYQEVTGSGQVVIDRFTVIREDGTADEATGNALAQMLQARLPSLARELRDAQTELATNASAPQGTEGRLDKLIGGTQMVESGINTSLLEPIDMTLSVAGVDVGGILPWIQRSITSRRTLHFAVYLQTSGTQVSGSVGALGISDAGLRLLVPGESGKPASLGVIADQLAHEILRRQLAEQESNRLEVLDSAEFVTLSDVMVRAARANRRANLSGVAQNDFKDLVKQITALADQAPNWPELGYYAARIAEYAKDDAVALQYYKKILPTLQIEKKAELAGFVDGRIKSLSPKVAATDPVLAAVDPSDTQVEPPPAAQLPPSVDHSDQVKLVPDQGNEGSVVGFALATALSSEILRAKNEDVRISARYIYYAARKAGGLNVKSDSGAFIKDGIAVLAAEGAIAESEWPYKAGEYGQEPPPGVAKARRFKISGTRQLRTVEDVKQALNRNEPVVTGIMLFTSIYGDEVSATGEIPLPGKKDTQLGSHAVAIVGYDDATQRMRFVNSWGTSWGDGGFGYLPYAYLEKYMSDTWTFALATK